jgi:hypothetical protein
VKGVLFNIVEDVVDETLSEDSWDTALDRAELTGAYTSLGDYPDGELTAIVSALSEQTGLDRSEVLRHAGCHGFAHLADRHGDLLTGVDGLGSLLVQLDDVIHPEVLKLYTDASPPSFEVTEDGPGRWTVRYRSSRGLCHLAEGLILGAADHYGTPASVQQITCVHRGDADCVLAVEVQGTP